MFKLTYNKALTIYKVGDKIDFITKDKNAVDKIILSEPSHYIQITKISRKKILVRKRNKQRHKKTNGYKFYNIKGIILSNGNKESSRGE